MCLCRPLQAVLSRPCGTAHGCRLCTELRCPAHGQRKPSLPHSLPHSLPTFPTQPRVLALPPPAFLARAAAFFQQKMPEHPSLSRLQSRSGCRQESGRSRPVPRPRRALAPCCLFIHSLISPLIHSYLGPVRPSRGGSLSPIRLDFLPYPSSHPGVSPGSSALRPPCAEFYPGLNLGRCEAALAEPPEPPARSCEGTEVFFHQTNSQGTPGISNEGSQPGKYYLSLGVLTAEEILTFTAPASPALMEKRGRL